MHVLASVMQKYSTYSASCFVSIKTIKTLPNLIELYSEINEVHSELNSNLNLITVQI